MATIVTPESGYYSIVRWVNDPARDEARNLAVLLVTEDGRDGGMKSVAVRSVLQGDLKAKIVESLLSDLQRRFAGEVKPALEDLEKLHTGLTTSLQVTEPRRCALVGPAEESLVPLYRSLVQPPSGGGSGLSSAKLARTVASEFDKLGMNAATNADVRGHHFDVVIRPDEQNVRCLSTLSFATGAKDWTAAERSAGHFIFSLERTGLAGASVINPPNASSPGAAWRVHERVVEWYDTERIPVIRPLELKDRARVDWLLHASKSP